MTKIIGLTGGSGAGKSVLAGHLRALGAHVINADAVYHALLAERGAMVSDIAAAFPGAVKDGTVDRRALGQIVFRDPDALLRLNGVTHPYVIDAIRKEIADNRHARALAIEAICLIESGLGHLCGFTVAVIAPPDRRIARIMARDGLDEESARLRVARQKPDEFYIQNCDKVIENRSSENGLRAQAGKILKEALA